MSDGKVTWEWWGHGVRHMAYNTSRGFYERCKAYPWKADIVIGEILYERHR